MTYKGVVKGKVIVLKGKAMLPEDTEVEVVVKERPARKPVSISYPKGSPQAILAALDVPPLCAPEDVDAMLQTIDQGKRPIRFEGIFDRGRRKK